MKTLVITLCFMLAIGIPMSSADYYKGGPIHGCWPKCPWGTICVWNKCVPIHRPPYCRYHWECPFGQKCIHGVCRYYNQRYCHSDYDCYGGKCIWGKCHYGKSRKYY